MSNVVVIGAGYVGLVTAAFLAELGHCVTCVERHEGRLETLKSGGIPIHEPGLQPIVEKAVADGLLAFSDDMDAVYGADVVYLAVGTPPREDGSTDLSQIDDAAAQVAARIAPTGVVVIKSTVPVGTGDRVQAVLEAANPNEPTAAVVSNPEFLREGTAVYDARFPDRVVIGANEPWAGDIVEALYAGLRTRVVRTTRRSSELIKYTANAFLATRISFANTIAQLCDTKGAVVDDVMLGAGLDKRVGTSFFVPGLGFGGSCFPKDVASLIHEGRESGIGMDLLESVVSVNDQLPRAFVRRMEEELGSLRGRTIGVLGLAFKGDTDDVRESRALLLIEALVARGATVRAYDPEATKNARRELDGIDVTFCRSALSAATDADAVVVATDWQDFARIDPHRLASRMRGDIVFDGRNLLDADALASAGLDYVGVGRPTVRTDATFRRVA